MAKMMTPPFCSPFGGRASESSKSRGSERLGNARLEPSSFQHYFVKCMGVAGRGQASDIDVIQRAVIDMEAMTQENAALVEEAAAASRAMQESAGALLEQVNFFTLPDDASVAKADSAPADRVVPLRDEY